MGLLETIFGGSQSKGSSQAFRGADARGAWNLATSPDYVGAAPDTAMPGFSWDWYNPERTGFQQPGFQTMPFERLTGGDYGRLEESLAATPLRRLAEQKAASQARFMANMRKTGMADDPSAYKLWSETGETPYTSSMTDILSNAAQQRYGLQAQELSDINRLGLQQMGDVNRLREQQAESLNALGLNQTQGINQLMASQYAQYNPARQQQAWQEWSAPREWWRQKMGLFYGGGKGAQESSSSSFGGILPGLGSLGQFTYMMGG